jgi:hypothetical protein
VPQVHVVSSPHPTPKRRKGSGPHQALLGHTECCTSYDCHDNALFWHGNASTALMRCNSWYHTIITCKPHGTTEFRNATSASPKYNSMCTRPFPPVRGGVWGQDCAAILLLSCMGVVQHL